MMLVNLQKPTRRFVVVTRRWGITSSALVMSRVRIQKIG